ncbi:17331_t:CDS:1, partial [Racocetra fulgida]
MPLSTLLDEHIIKTKEKLNNWNYKFYCKACIEKLGEDEGKKTSFPNKTDRIVQHLKKCNYFIEKTTPEQREEIFSLSDDQKKQP